MQTGLNQPQWIEVDAEGLDTGIKYHGRFQLKPFLTNAERADARRLAEKLCLGITQDMSERLFLTNKAFLKFHILDTDADWWKSAEGDDLLDQEPVMELASKINDLKNKVNPKRKERLEKLMKGESLDDAKQTEEKDQKDPAG